jgi:hypothetical protein
MNATVFRLLTGVERTDRVPDAECPRSTAAAAAWATGESAVVLTAALSFIVGVIHVSASVDHFDEYALYTPAFAMIAAFQMGWAVLVVRRPSRMVLLVGALASIGIAALWVVSRTSGVPIARIPWVPEAVGAADVTATVGECTIAFVVFCLLLAPRVEFARRAVSWLPGLLLTLLVVSVLYGLGSGHAG